MNYTFKLFSSSKMNEHVIETILHITRNDTENTLFINL